MIISTDTTKECTEIYEKIHLSGKGKIIEKTQTLRLLLHIYMFTRASDYLCLTRLRVYDSLILNVSIHIIHIYIFLSSGFHLITSAYIYLVFVRLIIFIMYDERYKIQFRLIEHTLN
jgi:hypothetical protein